MGRTRTPIGTFGEISFVKVAGGQVQARTRFRDDDGQVRRVSATSVSRDQAQAEEITQEAYLEIWRTSARFDPARGSALSWMMTIAHRKAVDRVASAEATRRRDTSHHQQSSEIDHDATTDSVEA